MVKVSDRRRMEEKRSGGRCKHKNKNPTQCCGKNQHTLHMPKQYPSNHHLQKYGYNLHVKYENTYYIIYIYVYIYNTL